jgi:hypothetical protein
MASTYTPNTHLELQGTGDNPGTWGSELNSAVFTIIDQVLGNLQAISLSSTPVTINTAQSQNNSIQFTGALTADVTVTFPAIGRTYYLLNNTTGAHKVTIASAGAGASVVLPQGAGQFYVMDGTNIYASTGFFLDTVLRLLNASDQTKVLGFDLSGITTGNARSVKAADASGTMILSNAFIGGQFQFVSSTIVAMKPFKGNVIAFPSGATAVLPSGGITSTITNASLDGTGGHTLSANTLYYAYLWNNGSAYVIDWSTTGHATDATTGIEIKSGDATRVLVGMAYPQTGPVFADSVTARLVASWFNRRQRQLINTLASNTSTGFASYHELTNALRCNFLAWGESMSAAYSGSAAEATSGGLTMYGGPAVDSSASVIATQSDSPNQGVVNMSTSGIFVPAEGFHFLSYYAFVTGGAAGGTWFSGNGQGVLSGNVIS